MAKKATFTPETAKFLIRQAAYMAAQPRQRVKGQRPPSQPETLYSAKVLGSEDLNGKIRGLYEIELGQRNMSVDPETGGEWVRLTNPEVTLYAYSEAEDSHVWTSGTGTTAGGVENVAQNDGAIGSGDCSLAYIADGAYVTVKVRGWDATLAAR